MKPVRQPSDTAVIGKVHKRLSNIERRLGGSTFPAVASSQQWAIKGRVSVGMELPPIIVAQLDQAEGYTFMSDGSDDFGPLASGSHDQTEETYVIGVKAWLGDGTATFEIRDTKTAGSGHLYNGSFTVDSSGSGFHKESDWIEVLDDDDLLFLHCTAITGTPRRLTVCPVIARLYGPA